MTKDYNFLLGRIYFTSNDGFQNTFVYPPTLDTLELKKDKGTAYIFSWKSKGVFNSKLKPLCTAFLHSIKHSEYRFGIKLDKDRLAVEQSDNLREILNVLTLSMIWMLGQDILLTIINLRIAYLEQLV